MQCGCYLAVDKKTADVNSFDPIIFSFDYPHSVHRINLQLSFQRLQQDLVIRIDRRIDCAQIADGLACVDDCRMVFSAK